MENPAPQIEEKKKKPRKRSTEVFFLLNLNERFATMSEERKQLFRNFAQQHFEHSYDIILYFHDRLSPDCPLENVDTLRIEWVPRVGPRSGKLFLCALVAIKHHGHFTFRANELREIARDVFGHSIYLSSSISFNKTKKWENYLATGFPVE